MIWPPRSSSINLQLGCIFIIVQILRLDGVLKSHSSLFISSACGIAHTKKIICLAASHCPHCPFGVADISRVRLRLMNVNRCATYRRHIILGIGLRLLMWDRVNGHTLIRIYISGRITISFLRLPTPWRGYRSLPVWRIKRAKPWRVITRSHWKFRNKVWQKSAKRQTIHYNVRIFVIKFNEKCLKKELKNTLIGVEIILRFWCRLIVLTKVNT